MSALNDDIEIFVLRAVADDYEELEVLEAIGIPKDELTSTLHRLVSLGRVGVYVYDQMSRQFVLADTFEGHVYFYATAAGRALLDERDGVE